MANSVPVDHLATDQSQMQSRSDEKEDSQVLSDDEPRDAEGARDQDAPPETATEQLRRVITAGEEFSILTVTQKKFVIMTASLASLFSPMATAIYCQFPTLVHVSSWRLNSTDPSLDTISHDLNVSNSQINITVTIFLVLRHNLPSSYAG